LVQVPPKTIEKVSAVQQAIPETLTPRHPRQNVDLKRETIAPYPLVLLENTPDSQLVQVRESNAR
jgi:hypothetical protein